MRQIAKQKQSRQKTPTLSIEQITPSWSRLLPLIPKTEKQEFYKAGKKLDISEPKFCVVGEAYGFDDKYFKPSNKEFCQECFNHSVNFGAILMEHPADRKESLGLFVKHWNKIHN